MIALKKRRHVQIPTNFEIETTKINRLILSSSDISLLVKFLIHFQYVKCHISEDSLKSVRYLFQYSTDMDSIHPNYYVLCFDRTMNQLLYCFTATRQQKQGLYLDSLSGFYPSEINVLWLLKLKSYETFRDFLEHVNLKDKR